jgi:hypothetical protein
MKEKELIAFAEKFLKNKNIYFVKPGEIGQRDGDRVEIIFLIPEALDPNVVIDPPDVRVWVNIYSGKVELIHQM